MTTAILGFGISIIANCIFAVRNFFDKNIQLALSALATIIWLLEYIFIFPSATYILIFSFTLVYLIAYHFRKSLLRFFKVDIMSILMILFIVLAILISVIIYEGTNSIYGIIILFLDLFSAYLFTAQGVRYKNGVTSILYSILDFSLGNYFVVAWDLINLVIPIFTIIKHKKEKIIDREGLKEYFELIRLSKEARRMKKTRDHLSA